MCVWKSSGSAWVLRSSQRDFAFKRLRMWEWGDVHTNSTSNPRALAWGNINERFDFPGYPPLSTLLLLPVFLMILI